MEDRAYDLRHRDSRCNPGQVRQSWRGSRNWERSQELAPPGEISDKRRRRHLILAQMAQQKAECMLSKLVVLGLKYLEVIVPKIG